MFVKCQTMLRERFEGQASRTGIRLQGRYFMSVQITARSAFVCLCKRDWSVLWVGRYY